MKASLEGFRTESTGAIEHGEQREESGGSGEGGTDREQAKGSKVPGEDGAPSGVNAAMVIEEFGERFWDLNVGELAVHLKDGMNDVSKNDLHGCEAMLYSQAHALQAIFVSSAHRATLSEEWFPNYEAHMRLALKAQIQCRATLETLATIKNPPVVFARQANIAQGPQQVPFGQVGAKNGFTCRRAGLPDWMATAMAFRATRCADEGAVAVIDAYCEDA